MQLTTFLVFFFVALAFSSPLLETQDYPSTVSKMKDISNAMRALDAVIEKFTGSRPDSKAVGAAAEKLNVAVIAATADINASTYTGPQSSQLRNLVTPWVARITSGLKALSDKKKYFDQAGVAPLVARQLTGMRSENEKFWSALATKLAPPDRDAMKSNRGATDSAYARAISVFLAKSADE